MMTPRGRLFGTREASGRALYRLYFSVFIAGISSLLYYRLANIPESHSLPWLLVTAGELWFSAMWVIQQSFRWRPIHYTPRLQSLPAELPAVDVMVCTADPEREPAAMLANTLLSAMALEYEVEKLAYYLSDDGGSELTFHAAYEVSEFAKHWRPFCRKYKVQPPAPRAFFSLKSCFSGSDTEIFRQKYNDVKKKFEEMQERINRASKNRKVPQETRARHKGFNQWDTSVNPSDHQPIVEVLLSGDGADKDAEGKPMPTFVYVSREKRPGHPPNFKAGALNALIRVSGAMTNAPFIINMDCDMYSNDSKTLHETICIFLDPEEGHRFAFVQYPQCFEGLTRNDVYANSIIRVTEIEFFGTNAHNGPFYCGTGTVHRRESLIGRRFMPDFQPKLDVKPPVVGRNVNWAELEEKAKALTSCTYEQGKPWGKEMGLMYGCPTEDVFTGLALHCRGWQSVYLNPERKAFLGLSPRNVNDTLIQYKRWATGMFQVYFSHLCPATHGIGKMKWGQILCYSFYPLWPTWSLPVLSYALLPPLALVNGIPLFPKASDPWFKVFAFLGIASHVYSLGELIWGGGTVKMWWNETRIWMMKAVSSYFFSLLFMILKPLGISESRFEITSKVIDEEAIMRYEQEVMEFGVASPMFVPPTTLSLVNLYCFIRSLLMIVKSGSMIIDQMALQIFLSGFVSLISLPLYEAMFMRKDNGRIPTSITIYSSSLSLALLYLPSLLI